MRGKLIFGAGVGIGYVLGARAGRERFDQISGQAKRLWENNTVQEAAGVVQTQAGRLYDEGKKVVTEKAQKMREMREQKMREMREKREHRHEKLEKQRQGRELRRREFAGNRAAPTEVPQTTVSSSTTPY